MSDLRKLARGESCMIRSPVCNYNPETTVLAHYRMIGVSGLGMKSPDLLGAWACSACHEYVDTHRDTDTKLMHMQGVARTQAELVRRGVVRW